MKRVTFGEVTVVEFPIIIGDNPSTLTGVPVALGNKEVGRAVYDLDIYESSHKRPRTREELRLCPQIRFQMALQGGSTLHEIEAKYIDMVKIQRSRAESFPNWIELVGLGVDKTYHPVKLSQLRARKPANIVRPSSRFVGGWGRDARGIQSATSRA